MLDAGCGTGENALHVASLGLSVLGVDVAETALAIAREKADDRGIEVEFAAADAFQLERLGRRFETVLDCGLFHTFDGDERPGYVASLASVTEHDGTLYVLCFSDDGPDTGPHPISQEELRAAFNPSNGWNVAAIEPDRIQTRYHDDGAPAWFATIKRIWAGGFGLADWGVCLGGGLVLLGAGTPAGRGGVTAWFGGGGWGSLGSVGRGRPVGGPSGGRGSGGGGGGSPFPKGGGVLLVDENAGVFALSASARGARILSSFPEAGP